MLKGQQIFSFGAEVNQVPIEEQVINFIEQVYWKTGLVPSHGKIAEHFHGTEKDVEALFADEEKKVVERLSNKGIDANPERSDEVLTTQQMVVINVMLTMDGRTERSKLKEMNEKVFEPAGLPKVSPQKWAAWKRQPAIAAYIRERVTETFKHDDYKFNIGLMNKVEQGDVSALKFYAELTGLYNPKLEVTMNVPEVVGVLFEIISKYVTDPEVLSQIGEDLQGAIDTTSRRLPVGSLSLNAG